MNTFKRRSITQTALLIAGFTYTACHPAYLRDFGLFNINMICLYSTYSYRNASIGSSLDAFWAG